MSPGCGLTTAPGRTVSGSFGTGFRKAFQPPIELGAQDQGALAMLARGQLSRADRGIDVRAADARRRTGFLNCQCKGFHSIVPMPGVATGNRAASCGHGQTSDCASSK